jgi:hypothetical protein
LPKLPNVKIGAFKIDAPTALGTRLIVWKDVSPPVRRKTKKEKGKAKKLN